MKKITVLPGDGIGPEIIGSARRVLDASGVKIIWEERAAGLAALQKYGDPLPKDTLDSISRNGVALKGPTATPVAEGHRSINVSLRIYFDLYVGLRPIKLFPGIKTRYSGENIDVVIFRENTEEFYIGEERYIDESHSAAEAVGRVTRAGSERIFPYAFDYAKKH